jgi:hypothetical protein
LTKNDRQKEPREHDFVLGETQSALPHEPRFELTRKETTDEANGFPSQRRWNSGFGSKRRWRT